MSAVALCLTCFAVVYGADRPIDGVKLVLKRRRRGGGTLLFLSKDSGFLFPAPDSSDDPAAGSPGGMVVELFALGDGTSEALSVPSGAEAGGWKVRTGKRTRYKFTNRKAPNETSPVKAVLLKEGKVLKIVARGLELSPSMASGGVAIRITTGTLRNCAVFGPGTIKRATDRKLVAKGASRTGIADCSDEALLSSVTSTTIVGMTTTTSASSTTSTVTTTTTTTTFPTTPPPDPATVAPALDSTVATGIDAAVRFLWIGDPPIQFNVSDGAIDPRRVAVIRGEVATRDGTPLAAVRITVDGHPEVGGTLSRTDGMFDLAVNGGGPLVLDYVADGYLPAQRMLEVPWQDWVRAPDVMLIPLDTAMTTVDLGTPGMKMARGTPVSDTDGTRQATVLFPESATATMVMPDGTTEPLASLDVRATEYTVGSTGPEAMPGMLPPSSAYTYAVELSADQALAAGATRVDFSTPLPFYVENFLGMPVGTPVPTGYYDRQLERWVPSPDGRVIEILSVAGGVAEVDLDGSGVAADPTALAALGITQAERQELAATYTAGTSLWRVPIPHFSAWDHNWPFGPPPDAVKPEPEIHEDVDVDEGMCVEEESSIIECQNQVVGEGVAVAGTPFTLNYRSNRVPGWESGRTAHVTVSGDAVPASLKRIDLAYEVAGQSFLQSFAAAPNQTADLAWDGADVYGRTWQGSRPLRGEVRFVYDAAYYADPAAFEASFGSYGQGEIAASQTRGEVALVAPFATSVGGFDARGEGLGGWTLDVLHAYDPTGQRLYLGSGETRRAGAIGSVYERVLAKSMDAPRMGDALTIGPDGAVYFADPPRENVWRRNPDGTFDRLAGCDDTIDDPCALVLADGMPATEGQIHTVQGLALGPEGSLYVAGDCYVFRIDEAGRVRNVAGTLGETACDTESGDGGPATAARLKFINDIDVGPDGSLYISNYLVVRRVAPDGVITRFAGSGNYGFAGDGGPASDADFRILGRIRVGPDGTVYIADRFNFRIRAVGPDGTIRTVIGTGTPGFSGDHGPARQAEIGDPIGLAVGPDGRIAIMEGASGIVGVPSSCRLRVVDADGTISTVGGTGTCGYPPGWPFTTPSGDLGINYSMEDMDTLAFGPDDDVYFYWPPEIWKVTSALPSFDLGSLTVASRDGSLLYEFNATGRHLRTVNALTGATLYEFGYDGAGRLAAVTQKTGGTDAVTTIERDGDGNPTAIVSPDGLRTTLAVDANGFLAAVTNPAGEQTQIASTATGLVTSLTNPRGKTSTYAYDAGRLVAATDDAGRSLTFSRTATGTGVEITRTTGLSRTVTYDVQSSGGDELQQTITAPDGSQATSEHTAGTRSVTAADGTVTSMQLGGDPRFGMEAPDATSFDIALPSGPTVTGATSRTATLADPSDLLSVTSLTEESTVDGRTGSSTYDAATRTLTATSPEGRTRTLVFDALGRVVSHQLGTLAPTTVSYDDRGRLASLVSGSGPAVRTIALTYDAQGFVDSVTDPLGRVVHYVNDAVGRPTSKILPDGATIAFGRDAAGDLTSLTPPGRPAHTFAYDLEGRIATITPPAVAGTGPTAFSHDADREMTGITRAGGETLAVAYGAAGRPDTITLARSGNPVSTYAFSYDAAGHLATVVGPGGQTVAYGRQGALIGDVTWSGTVAGSVGHTYDGGLRVASESVDGSSIVAFTYDDDDLLTGAGDLAITRDAAVGLPESSTLGVVSDAATFDEFGELSTYDASADGTEVYGVVLTRDAAGRITQKTETIGGATDTFDYTYDMRDQLLEVSRNGMTVETYAYDDNGNRVSATVSGTTAAGSYDAQDRLVTYGTTTYDYTPGGRLQARVASGGATTAYDYDPIGNLLGVTLSDGTAITYGLDGTDRRVARRVDGVVTDEFLYAGPRPVARLDGAGTVVSRFVYAGGVAPAYMVAGGATYRLITDQNGSVRLVVDATTGAVAQRIDYDAFGNVTLDTNPGFQPFGFAGGLYDPATGLVHFELRDYDPATGRWTAKDPAGFAGLDTNLYRYVGNDPVNLVDPTGLGTIGNAIAGFVAGLGGVLNIPGEIVHDLPGVTDTNVIVSTIENWNPVNESLFGQSLVDTHSTEFEVARDCGFGLLTLGGGLEGRAGSRAAELAASRSKYLEELAASRMKQVDFGALREAAALKRAEAAAQAAAKGVREAADETVEVIKGWKIGNGNPFANAGKFY